MRRRNRWGDNDRNWGPFTYAKDTFYKSTAIALRSGDDEYPGCSLRVSAFGHTFITSIPPILPPWRRKVHAGWDAATVARLGRDWYWDVDPREIGISLSDGHLSVRFGRQAMDSSIDMQWGCFLPWTQWRHVRHSAYDLEGNHFCDFPEMRLETWDRYEEVRKSCPTASFEFDDFDGERITATTRIEERQWLFGTGWFKWLSLFRAPRISRSLDIQFSSETGKRKGSWKGGTIGHGIEMTAGELHEVAFRRYCSEHQMTFIGTLPTPPEE